MIKNNKPEEAKDFEEFINIVFNVINTNIFDLDMFNIPLKKNIELINIPNNFMVTFKKVSISALMIVIHERIEISGINKNDIVYIEELTGESIEVLLNHTLLKDHIEYISKELEKMMINKNKTINDLRNELNKKFSKYLMVFNL